jgi:hypothetical protein
MILNKKNIRKMKYQILFLLILSTWISMLYAQNDSFIRVWGEKNKSEIPTCLVHSGVGQFYIAGHSGSNQINNDDAFLLLTDANGTEQFTKYYGTEHNERVSGLSKGPDALFMSINSINNFSDVPVADAYLYKLDLSGNVLWKIEYKDALSDEHTDGVVATADGGAIWIVNKGQGSDNEARLIKYDANGNVQWVNIEEDGFLRSLAYRNDEAIYMGGYIDGTLSVSKIVPDNPALNFSFPIIDANSTPAIPIRIQLDEATQRIAVIAQNSTLSGEYCLNVYDMSGGFLWRANFSFFATTTTPSVAFTPQNNVILLNGNRIQIYNIDGVQFINNTTLTTSNQIINLNGLSVQPGQNLAFVGTSLKNQGGEDAALVLANDTLSLLAAYTYGVISPNDDQIGRSIAPTPDGGYILCGDNRFENQLTDLELIKVDYKGDIEWANHYGTAAQEFGRSVATTPDGGYIASGYRQSPNRWYALKVNSTGIVQWEKEYNLGTISSLTASGLVPLSSGGYIGHANGTLSGNTASRRPLLIRLDENGDTLWTRKYGSVPSTAFRNLIETSDGGYAAAGWLTSVPNGGAWMLKFASNGDLQWDKYEPGGIAYGVQQAANGDLLFSGYRDEDLEGGDSLFITRITPLGNEIYTRYIGEGGSHAWPRVNEDAQGHILLSCTYINAASPLNQLAFYKWNSGGDLIYSRYIDLPFDPFAYDGTNTSDGARIAFGVASYLNTTDYMLVKTNAEGNVSTTRPLGIRPQLQVGPNPSTGLIQISLNSTPQGPVLLRLYDNVGKCVLETSDQKTDTMFEKKLDLTQLSAGQYFWQICVNGQCAGTQWIKQ